MIKKILQLANTQYYTNQPNPDSTDPNIYIEIQGQKHYERLPGQSPDSSDTPIPAGTYLFLQSPKPITLDQTLLTDLSNYTTWRGYQLSSPHYYRYISEGKTTDYQVFYKLEKLHSFI